MVEDVSAAPPVGDPLVWLLRSAGVDRSSLIRVTGPSGLSALMWLCRHGYQQVGYLKSGRGCPHEAPDALVVAHTCGAAWLARLLETGPHVREGGVLVFLSPLPEAQAADPIHRLLAAHGYDVERCVHGARRELHVARRRPLLRRAA
ncbi:MAG: hypothetical protein KKE02_13100 [Alphaproteobacteria bacterium]|nr:hypothetical protein [Alphaproteobacteria bacterium]MBU1513274.1 hypothetical protein [Alphaproteobacteria bacterium]MBU2093606.1 hypothetical protein [Alphaproteobacteria bacterium]MBU2151950.1 hypothetical protein [Alphaproteobacteria bacterium]MBU2307610.1 hypothetical protein [Alphaproteobacteria bacterium]